MPPASVISCEKLMVDASERSLTPVGTVLFVAVATLWLIATSAFAYYRWSLDQTALETEATVLEYNQIRYVDAAGVTHETERPYDDGWSPSPGETVRIRYVPGSTASLERVETAAQQRQVSLILPLLALPMFGLAAWMHRRMRSEDTRRARLRARDQRVPALGFRVVVERVGVDSMHSEYRVLARFGHRDQQYEAPSDRFGYDPSDVIDADRVQVWLDPDDPLQSMVAPDTLPPRQKEIAPRRARLP